MAASPCYLALLISAYCLSLFVYTALALPIYEYKSESILNYGSITSIPSKTGGYNVIIAADNTLLRLDENLTLLESHSTGPACEPSHLNICPDAAPLNIDNKPSVLVPDTQKKVLIYCGTAYYGRCSVYPWFRFNESMLLSTNKTSFIGSNVSSVMTFTKINAFGRVTYGITAGLSYDSRPLDYYPAGISTLTLRAARGAYTLGYISHIRKYSMYSGVSIAERYQTSFVVDYIYAFIHREFQYYLAVQKKSPLSSRHHTVLKRVKLSDYNYYSYVEIPLKCGRKSLANVATSAYIGLVGQDLARKLSWAKTGDQALYVTFASSRSYVAGDISSLEEISGSRLCTYLMSDIVEQFKQTQIDCYNDRNSRATKVPWMIDDPNQDIDCIANDQISTRIKQSDDFAGDSSNPHIRGLQAVEDDKPLLYTAGVFTSLAVTVRKTSKANFTIAVLGTSNGKIVKFHLGGASKEPFAVHPVTDSPGSPIQRQMPFDPTQENIFILTQKKVIKFPVHSCRVYSDCASCVTASDKTVDCGWCHFTGTPGFCSERNECKRYSWSENSCQPIITGFIPNAGPTAGGTPLTIHGSGFGNPKRPDDINLNVEVGQRICQVQNHTFEAITCVTGTYDTTGSFAVRVHAVDKTTSHVPYIVDGTANSKTLFRLLSAGIESVRPTYGPVSGGTNLTLTGTNLHIGGNQAVLVGETACEIYNKTNEKIRCTLGAFNGTLDTPTEASPSPDTPSTDSGKRRKRSVNDGLEVILKIDRASIISPDKYNFMDDPTITDISPRTSFVSGGLNLTISGTNLHRVENPEVVVDIHGNSYTSRCHAHPSGVSMTCPAPSVTQITQDSVTNVTASLSFSMDDVTALKEFSKSHPYLSSIYYVPDPVYHKFQTGDSVLLFDVEQTELRLKGRYLNLACTRDDVRVVIGNEAVCNVTELSTSVLQCEPLGRPDPLAANEPRREVWIYVGNLMYYIGDIRYVSLSTASSSGITALIVVLFIFVIAIIVALYWCYRRKACIFKPRPAKSNTSLTDTVSYHRNENNGVPSPGAPGQDTVEQRPGNEYDFLLADDYSSILNQLDSSGLRVHRDQLTLMEKVGEGHFGCVWRGLLNKDRGSKLTEGNEVAIKTHRSTMQSSDVEAFLDEAMIMRDFSHKHVLSLIGICLDREKGPMVILPFMHHGDLHTYICNPSNNPSVRDLMDFGLQIAYGMEYLCKKKFVHRDLAARNCMLDENLLVKVADFGLARDVYEKSYYRPSPEHTVPLPVRWMAFECFELNVFSTKSDVWAFGVVLWELMTRGIKPYPDVMDNWDILRYLQQGRRLSKPQYCPPELYDIMLRCWERDPDERPSAASLVHDLTDLMTSLERHSSGSPTKVSNSLYENVPIKSTYSLADNRVDSGIASC